MSNKIDPDAYCREHGTARATCDESHDGPDRTGSMKVYIKPIQISAQACAAQVLARNHRKLYETQPAGLGHEAAALKWARDYAERMGWTVVERGGRS